MSLSLMFRIIGSPRESDVCNEEGNLADDRDLIADAMNDGGLSGKIVSISRRESLGLLPGKSNIPTPENWISQLCAATQRRSSPGLLRMSSLMASARL
jgi:hypothetical protein